MPQSALVFTDRDELAAFLIDGEPISVANYLEANADSLKVYLEKTSGYEVDIPQMSKMLKSGKADAIADCRNFLADSIERNFNALPLTESKNIEVRASLPQTVERTGGRLRTLIMATPIILVGAAAAFFVDWGVDDSSPLPPSSDGEISESFDQAAVPAPTESDAQQITDEVANALQPFDHTVGEFDTYDVEGLMQNEDGEIYYYDWFVSNDVYEANVLTSQITGMPLSYSFAVQALESSMNPRAFNGIKACGLSQFVPTTLAEYAYQYSPLIGYDGIRDNLIIRDRELLDERDAEGGPLYHLSYDYTDQASQHTMIETCWDPHYNTRLAAVMHLREIGSLQRDLAEFAPEGMDYFPVTELQGYVAHFSGGSGGERLLRDLLSNDGASEAQEFFSEVAVANATNQRLLFHPKNIVDDDGNTVLDDEGNIRTTPDLENPRTVAEFFEFLEEDKGLNHTALPDFTDWGALSERIAANMESLNVTAVTIQKSNALAYSLTPLARPNPQ